jgi:hypothetical protein
METLLKDILIIIMYQLSMIEKRNLIRCNKHLYNYFDLIAYFKKEFIDMINTTQYLGQYVFNLEGLGLYTLEIIHGGCSRLLPKKYIHENNTILYNYPSIYFNSAARNFFEIIKILIRCNKAFNNDIIYGAAFGGNLKLLKWGMKNWYHYNIDTIIKFAIKNGQLHVLQWTMLQIHARYNNNVYSPYVYAIEYNQLDILHWIIDTGNYNFHDMCQCAAKYGQLHILKWFRELNYPWDEWVCAYASMRNHLEILKWAMKNGCRYDSNYCALYAARFNHLDLFKWMLKKNFPVPRDICDFSAQLNHFEMLKIGYINGGVLNDAICNHAAKNNNLEMLQWAIENGCLIQNICINTAAEHGHTEILKWLKNYGWQFNEDRCVMAALAAAKNNHLNTLKWLCENNCPMSFDIGNHAIGNNNLEMLIWIQQKGYLNRDPISINIAAEYGYIEILKWLLNNGCRWNRTTCAMAAKSGNLELLKYLRENGCKWDARTCSRAAEYGHLEILIYARENDCNWDHRTCAKAIMKYQKHILSWIHANGSKCKCKNINFDIS